MLLSSWVCSAKGRHFDILDFVTSDSIEGGYQDHVEDVGNYYKGKLIGTKYGITPGAYFRYYGIKPTKERIKALTIGQARRIYNRNYIEDPGFNRVGDKRIKLALVDYGINRGPRVAIMDLQRVLKTRIDGVLGSETLVRIQNISFSDILKYLDVRRERIKRESKKVFTKGLLNRVDLVQEKVRELHYGKIR